MVHIASKREGDVWILFLQAFNKMKHQFKQNHVVSKVLLAPDQHSRLHVETSSGTGAQGNISPINVEAILPCSAKLHLEDTVNR